MHNVVGQRHQLGDRVQHVGSDDRVGDCVTHFAVVGYNVEFPVSKTAFNELSWVTLLFTSGYKMVSG